MSPRVLQLLFVAGNDRRRTDRSRHRRRCQVRVEFLEGRITPTSVTSLSPMTGPLAGGTLVTINGTGLTGATAVDFGPAAGAIVSITSSVVTAYSPAGIGIVDVTVTTPSGTLKSNVKFEVRP